MKKNPYVNCFVVLKVNNSIKRIFFDEVKNYKNYSNVDFNNHIDDVISSAFTNDVAAKARLMLACESYLNSKHAINAFKADAENTCFLKSNMCVSLVIDIEVDEARSDESSVSGEFEINVYAYDENRSAFNDIAILVSDKTMKNFVESLSVKQQDLLFEFV